MKNIITKTMTVISILLLVTFLSTGCSTAKDSSVQPANGTAPTAQPAKDTAPATQPANDTAPAKYKDGTYEGVSDKGFGGELKVAVEVKDGKITKVTVTKHGETEGVGSKAVDKLPGEIVKAQSTKVDTVSGASYASAAIKEAVDNALGKAK